MPLAKENQAFGKTMYYHGTALAPRQLNNARLVPQKEGAPTGDNALYITSQKTHAAFFATQWTPGKGTLEKRKVSRQKNTGYVYTFPKPKNIKEEGKGLFVETTEGGFPKKISFAKKDPVDRKYVTKSVRPHHYWKVSGGERYHKPKSAQPVRNFLRIKNARKQFTWGEKKAYYYRIANNKKQRVRKGRHK